MQPFFLEFETGLTSGVGQRLHLPVVEETTAVEYNLSDACCQGLLGDKGTYLSGSFLISLLKLYVLGASGAKGDTLRVVDDLCVDVLVGEINSQTGALRRTGNLLANTRMNAGADGFAIDSAHILLNFVISV